MNVFKERLKEIREEKGLTQTALSKETGISQSAIALWESGNRSPNIDYIVILAKYFDVTADYLLGLEDYEQI